VRPTAAASSSRRLGVGRNETSQPSAALGNLAVPDQFPPGDPVIFRFGQPPQRRQSLRADRGDHIGIGMNSVQARREPHLIGGHVPVGAIPALPDKADRRRSGRRHEPALKREANPVFPVFAIAEIVPESAGGCHRAPPDQQVTAIGELVPHQQPRQHAG
jgi:hypothetical protein